MFKSWSSSYSYSSDGNNEKKTYETSYKDNKKDLKAGVAREKDLKNKNTKEMFYKSKLEPNNSKQIFGKSNNERSWNVEERKNNKTIKQGKAHYKTHSSPLKVLDTPNKLPQIKNDVLPKLGSKPKKNEKSKKIVKIPSNKVSPINSLNNSLLNDPFFKN